MGEVGNESFSAFYGREYAPVRNVVFALCRNWGVAEELTQDAFISALRRWDAVQALDRPDAWVRRVALNLATSRLRRVTAEARALLRLSVRGRSDDVAEGSPLREFLELVAALPRRQAQAVVLYYLDDLSVKTVAEVMGCAEGTVKAHLAGARRRLTNALVEAADVV